MATFDRQTAGLVFALGAGLLTLFSVIAGAAQARAHSRGALLHAHVNAAPRLAKQRHPQPRQAARIAGHLRLVSNRTQAAAASFGSTNSSFDVGGHQPQQPQLRLIKGVAASEVGQPLSGATAVPFRQLPARIALDDQPTMTCEQSGTCGLSPRATVKRLAAGALGGALGMSLMALMWWLTHLDSLR